MFTFATYFGCNAFLGRALKGNQVKIVDWRLAIVDFRTVLKSKIKNQKSLIKILSCTRNCELFSLLFTFMPLFRCKTTRREGQQQDASQETCLIHRVTNFREKRFGYG